MGPAITSRGCLARILHVDKDLSRLLNSFRVRLLLLLAALLVLTLSVQYFVNQRSVRRNTEFIVQQQQAIFVGVAVGVQSISTRKYLYEMKEESPQPLLGEHSERIKNILIVDELGNIKNSLNKNQTPKFNPDKSILYVNVKDVKSSAAEQRRRPLHG